MATIFDEYTGLWGSSIDVATVFADVFDGRHIIPPSFLYDGHFIAYRLGALDVNQNYAFGGIGTPCYILVNGNNIFSQITLLLGFGAVAYRIENNALGQVLGIHDVETINIVNGEPVERKHQAPVIHRFRAKKTDV